MKKHRRSSLKTALSPITPAPPANVPDDKTGYFSLTFEGRIAECDCNRLQAMMAKIAALDGTDKCHLERVDGDPLTLTIAGSGQVFKRLLPLLQSGILSTKLEVEVDALKWIGEKLAPLPGIDNRTLPAIRQRIRHLVLVRPLQQNFSPNEADNVLIFARDLAFDLNGASTIARHLERVPIDEIATELTRAYDLSLACARDRARDVAFGRDRAGDIVTEIVRDLEHTFERVITTGRAINELKMTSERANPILLQLSHTGLLSVESLCHFVESSMRQNNHQGIAN